jgi:hypothetical protein
MNKPKVIITADGKTSENADEDPTLPSKYGSRNADADTTWISVSSIETFAGALAWLKSGTQVQDLTVVSHGLAGELALGSEPFRYAHVPKLKDFSEVFAQNARIEFLGCELASGHSGERMAIALATTLLAKRGGTLIAHTTPVYLLWSKTFSFGDDVKISVTSGGAAVGFGIVHLVPVKVRADLARESRRYDAMREKLSPGLQSLCQRRMEKAKVALGPPERTPSIDNLYDAIEQINSLRSQLDLAADREEKPWWASGSSPRYVK